jgi:hypothetical protein
MPLDTPTPLVGFRSLESMMKLSAMREARREDL